MIYVVEMNYGNPPVQQLKSAWSYLEEAKAVAKRHSKSDGRTYIVYEISLDAWSTASCSVVYRTTDDGP